MPVVPLREFGRKPSKSRPKTEKEPEAERRLEQALGRLQAALPLGWANSESISSGSLGRESTSLWVVAEASVQQQASKAILGLAEALAEHFRAVERELSWSKRVQVNPKFLDFAPRCSTTTAGKSSTAGLHEDFNYSQRFSNLQNRGCDRCKW
jgi:hypothetical protein